MMWVAETGAVWDNEGIEQKTKAKEKVEQMMWKNGVTVVTRTVTDRMEWNHVIDSIGHELVVIK